MRKVDSEGGLFVPVDRDALGRYTIRSWHAPMDRKRFAEICIPSTALPIEPLDGWGDWKTAISVRSRLGNIRMIVFTTLEPEGVRKLG